MNNKIENKKWISVSESLPDIGSEVVVYCPKCPKKVTALCRFIRYEEAINFYWDNHYGGSNVHIQEAVTHWMPLPEPPNQPTHRRKQFSS